MENTRYTKGIEKAFRSAVTHPFPLVPLPAGESDTDRSATASNAKCKSTFLHQRLQQFCITKFTLRAGITARPVSPDTMFRAWTWTASQKLHKAQILQNLSLFRWDQFPRADEVIIYFLQALHCCWEPKLQIRTLRTIATIKCLGV